MDDQLDRVGLQHDVVALRIGHREAAQVLVERGDAPDVLGKNDGARDVRRRRGHGGAAQAATGAAVRRTRRTLKALAISTPCTTASPSSTAV